ncbi:MAG TPA: hypothetical protein VNP98_12785 [Chthoniobacterales bacterium]|nr:hypothetical protein [Chthoniobacterales bacterium]
MSLLTQILPAAIVAMMVAAGVCGLALFWGKERARGPLGPLAVGVAYLAGHLVITGWMSFPPADTTNWLPYFALAAAVLGAFCAVVPITNWARVIIFALVSTGALRLLLKPKFQYGWSPGEGWAWVACLGCAIVLVAVILDALARRPETAVEMPVFLLIVCAGTSGALMLSGSMLLGQFASVLAAAVLGTLVFTAGKIALGRGIVPVFSLLMGTLLVSGHFFAELPAASAGLLAFAPILALSYVGRSNKLLALGIRAAFVSIPVAVALVLAFRSSPPLDY